MERLDAGAGWKDVTPPAAAIELGAAPAAIAVTFAAGLVAGRPYRLIVNDAATIPIADVNGGALSSQPIVRPFALVPSGGTLALDPAF